jgi:hypothetical protein
MMLGKYRSILLIAVFVVATLAITPNTPVVALSGPFRVVSAVWGTEDTRINAAPGDENIPLLVTIQNVSNATLTGLSQTLFLDGPFSNMSGGRVASAHYAGSISPGMTGSTSFLLNINRTANPREYSLQMRIDYLEVATGVGKTIYLAKRTEVQVPLLVTDTRYMTIYSVNVSPRQAPPAGNITISGNILNTATSTQSNTNVSVTSRALIRGAFIFIGQIDPNIPRPFSVALQIRRDMTNGTYPIEIQATYTDSLGVKHVTTAPATIIVAQTQSVQPSTPTQTSMLDAIIEIIRTVFRFLFGFPVAVLDRQIRGGR